MYFSVSNGRVLSPGNYRDGDGGPPPLSSTEPSKMPPELSIDGLCSPGGTQRLGGGGPEGKGVKQRLPENPFYTVSLFREESSHRLQIFPRKPLLCPSVNGDETKGGKEKRTCWEQGEEVTKEGIKGGLGSAFKFRGPHWSAERDPLRGRPRAPLVRARSQAAAASALGPVGEFS